MQRGGGFTAEVTRLSPRATEKDIYDFFAYCGDIENVKIIRPGENASIIAYVTFKQAYALETAVLLNGVKIADQPVCISRWGNVDESDLWDNPSRKVGGENNITVTQMRRSVSTPGEVVTAAQVIVKTMISKGYALGKDALTKAKALDESYQVSSTAAAKVAELNNRIGLTNKIYLGMEAVKCLDEKCHVSEVTKAAASCTGRTAAAAANAVVNNTYFARGALWASEALDRTANVAAHLGSYGAKR